MSAPRPPLVPPDAVRGFSIGIPASATEPDLAGTLHSVHRSAAAAGGVYEILVAVNGSEEPAAALAGIRAFATAATVPLREGAEPVGDAWPVVRLLRLRERNKVAAWNAIRAAARTPVIVFGDADVRLAPDAIGLLLARLEAAPALAAATGREVAALTARDGLVARMAALPYRFDFGNVPGRLYALRTAALAEPMPAHVLHEDAYLSVRLGRDRFDKVAAAVVYLRPPTTWREYLDQRVRNELGKLQLAAEFPDLLRAQGFGVTPWRAFLHDIRPREYPLAALSLVTRVYARAWARRRARAQGFDCGWAALPSTKAWEA
jgi:cellulose synthase/poly-beta-1,6-N-acetylglucosamine synthase-like glycosyltransferase